MSERTSGVPPVIFLLASIMTTSRAQLVSFSSGRRCALWTAEENVYFCEAAMESVENVDFCLTVAESVESVESVDYCRAATESVLLCLLL